MHATAVSAVVLGLFYRWFAVADRYAIFLYGHLGATPFDRITRSRYWMAGLVAVGIVMVGYVLANWAVGHMARLRKRTYAPPAWWRVWVICALALGVGIPLITMTVNEPMLPPGAGAACVVSTLAGLGFALIPGAVAAERPADLVWTTLYGLGLMPALLLIRALELPGQGVISPAIAWGAALGGTLAGAAWLALAAAVGARRGGRSPSAKAVFVSGLCLSYLLMPVVHHLLETPPGYRYISASSNFFADHVGLQLLALLVAGVLSVGVTRFGRSRMMGRLARGRELTRAY
ncbi:MAG: hypothetical protein ACOC7Y_02645 [Chloroflexota bacterium]